MASGTFGRGQSIHLGGLPPTAPPLSQCSCVPVAIRNLFSTCCDYSPHRIVLSTTARPHAIIVLCFVRQGWGLGPQLFVVYMVILADEKNTAVFVYCRRDETSAAVRDPRPVSVVSVPRWLPTGWSWTHAGRNVCGLGRLSVLKLGLVAKVRRFRLARNCFSERPAGGPCSMNDITSDLMRMLLVFAHRSSTCCANFDESDDRWTRTLLRRMALQTKRYSMWIAACRRKLRCIHGRARHLWHHFRKNCTWKSYY